MKKARGSKGDPKTRQLICNEAARLMYLEGVNQYHTAKYMAARNILSGGGKSGRFTKPSHLPSNGEISEAIERLADFHEGDTRSQQLFAMRVLALDYMQQLAPFNPRLIGSVSTGRIKKSSDIDIHVFTDNLETLLQHIQSMGCRYETNTITISQKGILKNYTHIYIDEQFPIELSAYAEKDIRIRTRSSTDGKPIIRMTHNNLLELL